MTTADLHANMTLNGPVREPYQQPWEAALTRPDGNAGGYAVRVKRIAAALIVASVALPATVTHAQATRRDSLLLARAVADTMLALARVDSAHRIGVLTMDRLRATAAHFEADIGEKIISELRRGLGSRLDTIFSGSATQGQASVPEAVVRLWVVNGGRIFSDSARVHVTTVHFRRADRCTFGSTDEIVSLRREQNQWRISEMLVDTYADGICDRLP